MRYKSKVVEIDAVQWTGTNFVEVQELAGDEVFIDLGDAGLNVRTIFGISRCELGDYVVKIDGEVYPYDKATFEAKYEPQS